MDGSAAPAPPPTETPSLRAIHTPRMSDRLVALCVFAPSLALLLVAAWLTPNASGHSSHTQLGMAPCGFLAATGLPCATCGMTTSFAHAADGHLLAAAIVQPAGALLAVLTALAVLVSGYALITGASLAPLGRALWRPRTVVLLAAAILAGWAYTLTLAFQSHP